MTPIIVVAPVKNDAWILERFLSVASCFAQHIIISDQFSDDGSRDIYKKYPKVTVIDNTSGEYNEATRQIQLIKKARELFVGKKIILTLDADEILVANYESTSSWGRMMNAPVGSVFYFEKPDLYGSTRKAIRYAADYPMGMVEDFSADSNIFYLLRGFGTKDYKLLDRNIGAEIKDLSAFTSLYLEEPLFLHYAHTRLDIQKSKLRHYSVIEATIYDQSFKTVLMRRHKYYAERFYAHKIENSKSEWFDEWERRGIDMHTVEGEQGLYWRDIEVLRLFAKHGVAFFKYENIWDIDWEVLRKQAVEKNIQGMPVHEIQQPGYLLQLSGKLVYSAYLLYRKARGIS